MIDLKDFKEGEPLTADWVNAVNKALRQINNINGNNGLRVSYTPGSINIGNAGDAPNPIHWAQLNRLTQNSTYGEMTIHLQDKSILTLDIIDPAPPSQITGSFKLKFGDETTAAIPGNCGERGIQNILRETTVGADCDASCGPFPYRTIYISLPSDIDLPEIVENTLSYTGEGTFANTPYVAYGKSPSTDPKDTLNVFMVQAEAGGDIVYGVDTMGHITQVDGRWETVDGFYAQTRCEQFVSTNLIPSNWSSAGDGVTSWTKYADNDYRITFTSDQLQSNGTDGVLSDTLILTGLQLTPLYFGALFSDDGKTGISINLTSNAFNYPTFGPADAAYAGIESCTLINGESRGFQYSDSYVLGDIVGLFNDQIIAGTANAHQYGQAGTALDNTSALSSGHNISGDSDTVINAINDGSLGFALQIRAGQWNTGLFPYPMTIAIQNGQLAVRYET